MAKFCRIWSHWPAHDELLLPNLRNQSGQSRRLRGLGDEPEDDRVQANLRDAHADDPEEEVRCLARDEEEVLEKVLEACSDCHLCGHFGRRFAVEFSRPAA